MTVRTLPLQLWLALRPLPLAPLRPFLSGVLRAVLQRHPEIAERLGEHATKRFAIAPTDLPFDFLLEPNVCAPRLRAVRAVPKGACDVRIAGPFVSLLGLVDGSFDGDALFFSRDITVEGDLEAVIALRNAIDDAGIDVTTDIATAFGPVAGLAARAVGHFAATAWPQSDRRGASFGGE